MRVFAAPADQPRARRATDVLLLASALFGVAVGIASFPPGPSTVAFDRFVASLPRGLNPIWGFLLETVWILAVLLLVVALVRRRFFVVGQAVGAVVLAVLAAAVAARLGTSEWPGADDALTGTKFPTVWVAEATAVIVTVSPHLTLPLRRLGRLALALGVSGTIVVGDGSTAGTLTAVLIAIAAAAATRLAVGTSAGRPGLDTIAADLTELRVSFNSLEEAERQVAGVFHVRGLDDDGRALLIKVYGRDAHDTQRLARVARTLLYRGGGPSGGRGMLGAAEHEAIVTLLADRGGVSSREVVTAAATTAGDALLVMRDTATRIDQLDDTTLAGLWQTLARLAEVRIAHQQIEPATIAMVGGQPSFVDFGAAAVAPREEQLDADRAALFATTASIAGSEAAVRAAIDARGAGAFAEILPFVQPAAFSPSLRRALKAADIDADQLREQAASAIDAEAPQPVKLRRVTAWSLAQFAMLALASYGIITAAASIDWDGVGSALSDATWSWIAIALIVGQLPRVGQAVATLGSVPSSLALGPVYGLHLSMGYLNVALPSSIARMAVSVRFLQRQGIAASSALTSGVIDTVAAAVVQGGLVLLLLILTEVSLALDLPAPDDFPFELLAVVAGVLVVALLVVLALPAVRTRIVTVFRERWPEVRAALGTLGDGQKRALLLGGNVAAELLFATTLGLLALGLGYRIAPTELIVITASVALLSGIIPVPGGIGVAELGLTIGLTAAGLPAETALATAILYRVATFYLPPTWGFFALGWLRRNRYL